MIINGLTVLISGNYSAFKDGFNGAGVYLASGLVQSQTFKQDIYIGSSKDLQHRIISEHVSEVSKGEFKGNTNQILFNYSMKYGSENIVWFLLESCQPHETLTIEQKYLDLYRPFRDELNGFNISHTASGGGIPGRKFSEDHKRKISEAHKGMKHTEESKRKMSESQKGVLLSAETKRKISLASGKYKHSEESKAKISASHMGKKRDFKTIEAVRNASSKIYQFVDPNGIVIELKNLTKFCEENNLDRSSMTRVFQGVYKFHKGYTRFIG